MARKGGSSKQKKAPEKNKHHQSSNESSSDESSEEKSVSDDNSSVTSPPSSEVTCKEDSSQDSINPPENEAQHPKQSGSQGLEFSDDENKQQLPQKSSPPPTKRSMNKSQPKQSPQQASTSQHHKRTPNEIWPTESPQQKPFATPSGQNQREKKLQDDSSFQPKVKTSYKYIIVFGVVLVASLLIAVLLDPERKENEKPEVTKLSLYQDKLKEIKRKFPSQSDRLWKIINIELEGNLSPEENTSPAVLLLASDEEGNAATECLARKLSEAFSTSCRDNIVIDGRELGDKNPEEGKVELDHRVNRAFRRGACAAVISRFEKLPAFTTTIFYQFCENDNAPYKDVAILLTLQVDATKLTGRRSLAGLPEKKWDPVVEEFISGELQSRDPARMTDDMIGGLLSRIAASVVWVRPERELEC